MKKHYLSLLFIALSTLTLVAQVPSYVPTNGLVGWWPFNGNANDLSGNGNNGTVNGATLTTDRFGSANSSYLFPTGNTNSRINVGSNINSYEFTYSVWAHKSNFRVNGLNVLISSYSNLNKVGFEIQNSQQSLGSVLGSGNTWSAIGSPTPLTLNNWQHIVVTFNGSTAKLFVNGIQVTNCNLVVNWPNTSTGDLLSMNNYVQGSFDLIFGDRSHDPNTESNYEGKLDDIGVWNRALTQAEITSLYNANTGVITALNCNSFTQSGNLFSGQVATNVSIGISYTGGNAGTYPAQTYNSSGVTGLVASLVSGNFTNGSGTLNFNITGQPTSTGNAIFNISIGGQICSLIVPITSLSAQYPANSLFCTNGPTAIVDVTNPTTGRTWMDRNLGASQAATSSTDQNSFGDLYQWGRRSDGHQCRTSTTTTALSNLDQPTNGNFIIAPNVPTDWRSPQNNNLWQGTSGTNNPCPFGYRIPTEQEFIAEQNSWTNQNASGAFNSVLKIPLAGDRYNSDALIYGVNQYASIWTSTTSGTFSKDFAITTSGTYFNINDRADGRCIRCIKEVAASLGSINCNGVSTSAGVFANQAITGTTTSIPYTGGNGGLYASQILNSTGVTGLTATLNAGLLSNGAGSLTLTLSGTPSAVGFASFTIEIGGQNCTFNVQVNSQGTVSASSSTICAGQSTTLTAAVSTTNSGTPCAATGLPSSLNTGLVGYWPFCGNANDASGNGNNGTPMNGVALTTDRFGNANSAYSFDGVNDYVIINNTILSQINGQSNLTLTYWFKTTATETGSIWGHWANNGGQVGINCGLASGYYSGKIEVGNYAGCCAFQSNLVTPYLAWHQATIVFNSNEINDQRIKIYIDGIFNTAVTGIANIPIGNASSLFLGRRNTDNNTFGDYYFGELDDVATWNRALTAAEVQSLYTQGQTTYSWSPGGATTPSITVSPTTTTTYTCTVTNGGATSTLTQTVTVNPIPSVNAGSDQTVFAGSSVTLAGSGATTYSWNNGVTNNLPFTATTTTTYTVTGTSNGCTATDQVLVTVLPAPTLSASSSTICAGQSTTLTAASANTGTPCAATGLPSSLTTGLVGYWPFCGNANDASGNGLNGAVNGATLTTDRFGNAGSAYSFDGNSIITVAHSNLLNISNEATISLWAKYNSLSNTVNFILQKGTGHGCNVSGYQVTYDYGFGTVQNGVKGLGYGIGQNGDCNGIQDTSYLNSDWHSIIIVYSFPNNHQLYFDGISLNGGNSTGSNSGLIQNSISPLYIGGGFSGSVGHKWNGKLDDIGIWNRALTATEIQQLYSQGQTTYSWSPGGATTPSITVSPTSTTTYTCTVTNGGATSTLTQTVTVNPLPTVNAGADQTVFAGNSITLAGSGATTYTWNNGVTNNTPFTPTATTTYTLTGTSNGCTATDQVLVTVLPAPTVSASSSTICAGQSTTLTAASANTGTPCAATGLPSTLNTGLVGYWPFCGNANDASGNGRNGIVSGATLTTDRFGNANSAYNFTGTTNSITIPNSTALLPSSFSVSSWCTIDNLMPSNYDATIIGQLNGSVANDRKWLFGYRSIASERGVSYYLFNNSGNFFLANNYTLNWQPVQSQWYHISWVFESNNSIKTYVNGVLHSSVAVNQATFNNIANNVLIRIGNATDVDTPLPLPWNGKIDDVGIWNRVLTLNEIQQLYTQGQATYSWSPGGATTPSITVSPTSTTTYTCTVTNGGANSSYSQTVTVNPIPTVNAGVDQTVFAGSSVTLAGSGATSYTWNNGVTNNTPFTANATTTYTVTGTSNGCTATDQVLVTVLPAPTVSASSSTICSGQSTTLTAASASTGTPCASTGLPSSLTSGLVGYWPFCGNANDASGNGNNGTVNGATLTTDRFGNTNSAYSFDGVNDYIGTNLSGITGQNSRTISFWFNSNNNTSGIKTMVGYGEHASLAPQGSRFDCTIENGKPSIDIAYTYASYPVNNLQNNWKLYTVAFESSFGTNVQAIKLYIDGVLQQNPTILDPSILINTGNLFKVFFGAPYTNPSGNSFNGKLDDIGIWNRALTASEIQQLYSQGQTTYSWSPGGENTPSITVSPTTTTTYTCTITNGGATSTLTQTVTVNPIPTVNAGVDQTVFAGNLVTLSGSGAATYTWNNGVTNNIPFAAATTTNYTVTGTSNGCTATDQVLVTVLPNATISATNTTLCAGQSTTITANVSALSAPCSSSGLAGTLSNGLVGYWPFCGNANDASGNGNNGTVNGATLTTDRFGNTNSAYSFDGVNDEITAPRAHLNIFTTSVWIQASNTNCAKPILDAHNESWELYSDCNNGHLSFIMWNANGYNFYSTNIVLNQNTWYHVACVYSSSQISIYVNGTLITTQTTTTIPAISGLLRMGSSISGAPQFLSGKLDDIGIWNRALTASEIQQLYTQGQATYSWSPGGATTPSITVSPTTTTTYTCTVTVNGVSTNVSQTITVNPSTNVNAGPNQTVCSGTPVTLTATGASTYSWTNGVQNGVPFTPTSTQTYTVTGNNSFGCSSTSSVTVTVNPTPTATISNTGSLILCQGGTVTLNASAGSNYLWSNGATTQSITVGQAGNYSVQVFNASGCSATSSAVTVVVNPLPAPTIIASGPLTFCQGGSVTLTSTGAQSYVWNNSATSQAINVTTSGSYTVTVVNDKGCTGTSAPVIVTVISNPPATINVIGGTSICAGQSTTLSAPAGYSYLWNTGSQTQFLTVTQSGIYTVQVTNANGCSSVSASVQITVNTQPSATISASGPTNFCQGQSVMLTAPTASSYLWSNGAQTQSIIVSTAGTYSVTVTGQGGCSATSTPVTVNVYALPSPTIFASGPTTFCQGGSVILSAPSGYNYLWSTGSPLQNLIVTNSGTYQVLISNAFGCQIMSNPATVIVNPLPNVNAGMDQTVCAGTPVTLLGSGANSFSWNNGVSNGVPFVPTSTQTYTVTGTNGFGCTAQDQVIVTVNPLPTVSAGPNQNICAGQSAVLVGTGAQFYLWSGGVINGIPFTPLATQTYTVTGYNAAGCSNTASTTITLNPLPTAVPGANATITCNNSASGVQIGSAPVTGLQYSWTPTTGLSSPFVANPFANPTSTTIYSLLVTNATGCSNLGQVTVNVNTTPPLALTGPNVEILCSNPNGVGIGTTPIAGLTYNWSPSAGLSASNIANPVANPSTTTIYMLTVTNLTTGCSSNASVTVFVNNTSPTVNAGPDLQVCLGQAVTLNGSGINVSSFSWNNGVNNGVPFVPSSTGTYTLTGINSANGCTSTDNVLITVNSLPNVNAGPDQTICAGANVVLAGSGALSYSWNNNVVNNVPFVPTATLTYTVTGTNANGCSASDNVIVTVGPGLVVNAGNDLTVCQGSPVTLTATGANTYSWTGGVVNGQSFVPTSTQTYTVTGTGANGCTGTDAITVTVAPIPTAVITPNGPITICQGGSVMLSAAPASSYQWRLNGTDILGAQLQNYIAAVAGIYTLKVTNNSGCSALSSGVTVSISSSTPPTISANGPLTICTGGSVVLTTATANTYQWKLNGVDIANATNPSFTATAPGNYSVVTSNSNGCSGTSASVAVNVSIVPTPVINAGGNTTICSTGSVNLSTTASGTLQWNLNTLPITGASNPNYPANAAGSYTVTATNNFGCSATSAAIAISVSSIATPVISPNGPITICSGSNQVLSTTAAGSLQWNLNSLPIANQTNASYTAIAAGIYTVTTTNSFGCSATSAPTTIVVSTQPIPVISANGPTTICAGSSLQLSTTASGTFQWYLNGTAINGATTNTHNATQAGNYTLVVQNSSGCQATSNAINVTLGPPPTPTITPGGPLSLCSGGNVLLSVTAAASYQWKLNSLPIGGATNQTYSATAPGGYTVTVVYPNGCTATSVATIVNGSSVTAPIIVANGSTSICAGSSVELIASGAGSYAWMLNGTTVLPGNSPNLIATAAGNYTVTVTNSAGCSATSNPTTITVVSLAAPTITASGPTTICAGANLTLSTTASGPYQWKLNGAAILNQTNSSLTVSATGVYSLTVNNSSGCSANSNNITVTVVPLPSVSISANGPTVICQGSSVQLSATASPGCTFQWKRNGLAQSNGQGATFVANNTGSYTVTVTNATGCQTTSNVIVVSHLQATITALGSTTICQGSVLTLQATTGVGYTYQWIKNGLFPLNPTTNSTYNANTSGSYYVIVTTPSGCQLTSNTIQVQVIQNPTATIIATGNTTICSGSSITLLVNNGGPNVTYQWRKNGVNIQNANSTSLSVTQAGTYTVLVANVACPTSSQVVSNAITITVNPTPTPNINTTATTIPLGSSVTLFTTNMAGNTLQWQKLNGNNWQNINGATNSSYQANTAGAYRVKATNSFGCSGNSSVVNLVMFQMPPNDDVVKTLSELNIALYPNPTNEVIYLDVPDTLIGQTYTILDINGRILLKETILEKTSTISVLNLARGTYWIQMENTQPLQFVKN